MLNKKVLGWIGIFLWSCLTSLLGNATPNDGLGHTIQIQTNFRRIIGDATLSIVVRDLDHNQNIPYMFDITQPNNTWFIVIPARNYLITASRLQVNKYKPCCNQYRNYRTSNFCHLESNGRIMRGKSMRVIISGDLSPFPYTYSCNVTTFPGADFTIYGQKTCSCPEKADTTKKC